MRATPFFTRCPMQRGFTLVELSIVIIIVSLLMASGLAVGTSMVQQANYIDTQKKLVQIRQSLHDYYIVNGHLPCAARLDLLPSNANFATSVDCSSGSTGTYSSGSPAVRIGMVPARTLGLTDRAASDAYGNRIIYAVTEGLANPNTFGSALGGVVIRDGSTMTGNLITSSAAYMLVSPGADKKGGFSFANAGIGQGCTAGNLDTHNCIITDETFRDAAFNSGSVAAKFFDDVVDWGPKFHFMALDTQSNALWASSGDSIFAVGTDDSVSTTKVGIGTSAPISPLHVVFDNVGGIGWENDYIIDRFENTNDNSPINNRRARGTFAAPLNLQSGDGLSGIANLAYIGGAWQATASMVSTYYGNGTTNVSRTVICVSGTRCITYPESGVSMLNVPAVNGSLRSDFNGGWSGLATWDIAANNIKYSSLVARSDKRLKTDITPIDDPLERLLTIKGVHYRWNGKDGATDTTSRQMGVLAQDVQKAFPDIVSEGSNGYLTVQQTALVAPLIESVRILKDRNDALKAEVTALREQVEANAAPAAEETHVEQEAPMRLMDWVILVAITAVALYASRRRVA